MRRIFLAIVFPCALVALGCGFEHATELPPNTPLPPPNPPVTANTPTQPPSSGPNWPADLVKQASPPAYHYWAIPWCEAICDTRRRTEPGTVSISSLKLHAVYQGRDFIMIDQSFGDGMCGGLYIRSPWYGYGSTQAGTYEPMPFTIGSGFSSVRPSDQQDKVYHWYSCGRVYVGTPQEVWVEARVKITGSACFGLGWDYWSDEEGGDAVEGGGTRWYYDTDAPNWTTITLGRR